MKTLTPPSKMVHVDILDQCTAQEVFDFVAWHLLSQNKKSKDGEYCLYLSNDGLKCAAGCLFTEEEYKKYDIEDYNSCPWGAMPFAIKDNDRCLLIERLQLIHDKYDINQWVYKLHELASIFQLDKGYLNSIAVIYHQTK